MPRVFFTQYLRPRGTTRRICIYVSPAAYDKAKEVTHEGGRFEVEILSTGEVSLECVMEGVEIDTIILASAICINEIRDSSPVVQTVEKLICAAWDSVQKLTDDGFGPL